MLKLSYIFDDLLLRPIGWGGGCGQDIPDIRYPDNLTYKKDKVVERIPGQRSKMFSVKKIAEYLEKQRPRSPARAGSC